LAQEARNSGQFAQVNSLSRIILFIFWAILLVGIVSLLRGRLRSSARRAANARPASPPKPVTLLRDPYCGTHVSPEVSVRATQAGRELHFCSAECRDRYLRSERQAAGA
jgi:YHS domain-containing protein